MQWFGVVRSKARGDKRALLLRIGGAVPRSHNCPEETGATLLPRGLLCVAKRQQPTFNFSREGGEFEERARHRENPEGVRMLDHRRVPVEEIDEFNLIRPPKDGAVKHATLVQVLEKPHGFVLTCLNVQPNTWLGKFNLTC